MTEYREFDPTTVGSERFDDAPLPDASGESHSRVRRLKSTLIERDDASHPIPPQFSDEAIALRFAEAHTNDLRFVAKWSQWMLWSEGRWLQDDTLQAYDRVRALCRQVSAECNKEKVAVSLASAKAVASIEKLARSDRRIAATVNQWDADIDLLNTPGGSVDLRTGICTPHRRSDYCTKITAVAPAPINTPCPRWMEFLIRVTNGDEELLLYLQRMVGYCLTGSVKEKCPILCLRNRSKRKRRFDQYHYPLIGRLCNGRCHGNVHGFSEYPTLD